MKRITVTIEPDNYAAFDKRAHNSDVTASWLIRRSMREFLDRHGESGEVEIPLGHIGQANLKVAR